MQCKICDQSNDVVFNANILNKYNINYYLCSKCGFVQTEEPYWLDEAYNESINISDTGIMVRNLYLSKISTLIIFAFFNKNNKYLDFAGGYGVFTRLMRDIGYDFYWNDKYSANLLARGFEYKKEDAIELITSFESFEHFVDPLLEIENMLKTSKNILFSTELIPDKTPLPDEWWYYGLEHGQHISFYNLKTLEYIAKKYKLNLYSNGKTIHLLTNKKLNDVLFKFVLKTSRFFLFDLVKMFLKSKTENDMNLLITNCRKNENTL